jgi:signal transduction histidine kinase
MTTVRTPAKIIPRAFPGIRPDEIQEIIVNSRVRIYPPETVLCHENAIEKTFYMILEGDFEVTKMINNQDIRLLTRLTAGDFFGEMALIHNAPRAATVTSKSEVVVLELDKEGFDRVLKHSPSVSMAMVREISNRLRQNDAMAIEDLRVRASELAAAYQKLAEQEMARNEFLSSVAHELRTPLMAASGYLTHLQRGSLPKDQLDVAVDTVSRNVSQIISLVNDILFLQEIELVLPEFQPVDMIQITDSIVNRYRKKADAQRVRLRVRSDRNLPRVLGDARALERALTALVDNAIKFSPYGGDVEIRLLAQRDRVEIAVEDHGIGIDPAIRPHIFDRFFHIEKSGGDLFGGIGLGLAITRQVIQQHRGTLDVESKPGRGSTFTISLLKTV